jgi:hypothetical protein
LWRDRSAWSYTLGKYVAQLRKMWAETAQVIQKEFDEAGVDVQVPKNIPTRGDLNREIGRALTPVTKPFQESLDATKKEIDATKKSVSFTVEEKPSSEAKIDAKPAAKPAPKPTTPVVPPAPKATTGETPAPASNGHAAPDFGTWSKPKDDGA